MPGKVAIINGKNNKKLIANESGHIFIAYLMIIYCWNILFTFVEPANSLWIRNNGKQVPANFQQFLDTCMFEWHQQPMLDEWSMDKAWL
jgi:hypothetical protein